MRHDRRSELVAEEDTGKLREASVLVAEAREIILEATLAIRFGFRAHDLVETFHPYPTRAEDLKVTAIIFTKDVKQLSCCA